MAARARAGGAAEEIPDELLQDVFARLPGLRDLLRCAATSKRWLRLVAERGFLRRVGLWPETSPHPSVLVGVFSQNSYASKWSCFERSHPHPSPPQFLSLQPGDDGARHTLDSFFAGHDVLFNYARPLASRRGLLLVRVWLPSSNSFDPSDPKLQLVVCRPMGDNKRRSTHLLPPPAFDDTIGFRDHHFIGEALLTDADYGGGVVGGNLHSHQEFRVVLNYTDRDGFASACCYSSATRSWGAPLKLKCPSALIRCGPRAGLVIHSVVRWLYMGKDNNFYTLNVDTTTTQISLTKIPIKANGNTPPPIPCIAGEEGMLSFVTMPHRGVLELWTKLQGQDNTAGDHDDHGREDEEGWQHSALTDLGSSNKIINNIFFAESRGALLLQQGGVFITVDLKTKQKMVVDLKDDKMRHIKGAYRDGESCSSTYCRGSLTHYYGGRKCSPAPPVCVLYELDWVFSRTMLLAASSP